MLRVRLVSISNWANDEKGKWLSLPMDEEKLKEEVSTILYQGNPKDGLVKEFRCLSSIKTRRGQTIYELNRWVIRFCELVREFGLEYFESFLEKPIPSDLDLEKVVEYIKHVEERRAKLKIIDELVENNLDPKSDWEEFNFDMLMGMLDLPMDDFQAMFQTVKQYRDKRLIKEIKRYLK